MASDLKFSNHSTRCAGVTVDEGPRLADGLVPFFANLLDPCICNVAALAGRTEVVRVIGRDRFIYGFVC